MRRGEILTIIKEKEMAHTSITQYLREVNEAIQEKDGFTLAELLSFKHPHVMNPRLQIENPEAQCQKYFETPYDEMIAAHMRCTWAVSHHDFVEAYGCQAVVVQAFTKAFQNQKEENWSLPVLFVVCLDLRLFANSADIQLTKRGRVKPGETLEKAAEAVMSCFRVCASDNRSSEQESKKWGMLNLINQLFKIYFKLNTLHLCTPLIRAMEKTSQDRFDLAQVVTYRYYVGRKAIFDGDFAQAEDYLSFAFSRCHRACKNNKRLILICLLPVKMLLGHMPCVELLRKYDLMQFAELSRAVRSGNLLQFNQALDEHESFFIKCGIYLILEKLRIIIYRNLFKKVYLLMKTHQLPIDAFVTALRFMQVEDVDSDEAQCIIANLIYENRIKGYISLQHQKLVVSKQNPFPSLASTAS